MTALPSPRPPPADLGAATEARILAAVADRCMITAKAAAQLLGLDETTLRGLTDDAAIRAVRRGKVRSYTEADVRLFLSEGPDAPCRSTNRPKAVSGNSTSSGAVVAITEALAARRNGMRNGSSPKNAGKPR